MEITAVTFDTHKAVKTLKNAGLEYSQAEAVVETINQAVNETVATKEGLDNTNRALGDLKENMATKEGLDNTNRALGDLKENMATKEGLDNTNRALDDLKKTVEDIKESMVTKEALDNTNRALGDLKKTVDDLKETVDDLKDNMATKDELNDLKENTATKEYVKMEIAKAIKHIYIISLTQTVVLVTLVVTLSKLL